MLRLFFTNLKNSNGSGGPWGPWGQNNGSNNGDNSNNKKAREDSQNKSSKNPFGNNSDNNSNNNNKPDYEDILTKFFKTLNQKIKNFTNNTKNQENPTKSSIGLIFLVVVLVYLSFGFYKVDPDGKVNPRNLRDKYNEIIVSVGKDKETGNQSGKEGDLSQTYKLVQQITDEMDEAEAEKDYLKTERAEDKVKLEGNEASILGKRQRNSAIGTVNADGTVTVDEERAARRAARTSGNLTGFEKSLFEMLNNDNNDSSSSSTTIVAKNLAYYSDIEEKMRRFCEMKGYNLDTLVVEAYAPTQEDARTTGGKQIIEGYRRVVLHH